MSLVGMRDTTKGGLRSPSTGEDTYDHGPGGSYDNTEDSIME